VAELRYPSVSAPKNSVPSAFRGSIERDLMAARAREP
jgi:hypothetical protein